MNTSTSTTVNTDNPGRNHLSKSQRTIFPRLKTTYRSMCELDDAARSRLEIETILASSIHQGRARQVAGGSPHVDDVVVRESPGLS